MGRKNFAQARLLQILSQIIYEPIGFAAIFQINKVLNANFLAKRIGMNPTLLSQYVRGNKQPSANQANKIIDGINTIGKELAGLSLV